MIGLIISTIIIVHELSIDF